jgi:hypothetical protein
MRHVVASSIAPSLRHVIRAAPLWRFQDGTIIGRPLSSLRHVVAARRYYVVGRHAPSLRHVIAPRTLFGGFRNYAPSSVVAASSLRRRCATSCHRASHRAPRRLRHIVSTAPPV